MAITRYAPRESLSLSPWTGRIHPGNRIFQLFGEGWPWVSDTPTRGWLPVMNVEESADEVVLTAELPGMDHDDINLEIENNVLTLSGEKVDESQENMDRRYHVWERRYGSFQRSFSLPSTVDAEKIEARFDKGVLHVHMPKLDEAKGRRISIRKEN